MKGRMPMGKAIAYLFDIAETHPILGEARVVKVLDASYVLAPLRYGRETGCEQCREP